MRHKREKSSGNVLINSDRKKVSCYVFVQNYFEVKIAYILMQFITLERRRSVVWDFSTAQKSRCVGMGDVGRCSKAYTQATTVQTV